MMIDKFIITIKCPATGKDIDFGIQKTKDYDWHLYDKRIDSGSFSIWGDWKDAVEHVLSITPNKVYESAYDRHERQMQPIRDAQAKVNKQD
tara:strand:- start:635 stop:907 length:273 start_codon:yes stop_codon:yes gene_type:complete